MLLGGYFQTFLEHHYQKQHSVHGLWVKEPKGERMYDLEMFCSNLNSIFSEWFSFAIFLFNSSSNINVWWSIRIFVNKFLVFFSLKAFVLFFFNNGGICVFCNLCFVAGNWNSVQVKSLTTHAPKQYCFYLWNINCYLIELPFYIFKNVLDKFISQTFTFFFITNAQ